MPHKIPLFLRKICNKSACIYVTQSVNVVPFHEALPLRHRHTGSPGTHDHQSGESGRATLSRSRDQPDGAGSNPTVIDERRNEVGRPE